MRGFTFCRRWLDGFDDKRLTDKHYGRWFSVEVCHYRSNLLPGPWWPYCEGCVAWEKNIPMGSMRPCEACGTLLVAVSAKWCPMCKTSFVKVAETEMGEGGKVYDISQAQH